jgi:predicted nucleic acid-binding protein
LESLLLIPFPPRFVSLSVKHYNGEIVEHLRRHSDFPQRHTQLRELLREVQPYFLTYTIMERYADIRRLLRPPYGAGLIGDVDTLIAATAVEHSLTLVTTDTDFDRVPGLSVMHVPRQALSTR